MHFTLGTTRIAMTNQAYSNKRIARHAFMPSKNKNNTSSANTSAKGQTIADADLRNVNSAIATQECVESHKEIPDP